MGFSVFYILNGCFRPFLLLCKNVAPFLVSFAESLERVIVVTLGQLQRNLRQLTPCFVSPKMMIGCDYQVWFERKTLIACATTLTNPVSNPYSHLWFCLESTSMLL